MIKLGTGRFQEALARGKPLLIDGGLATLLESMGQDIGGRLWSAKLLHSHPKAIQSAHRKFLEAGADVIISASYQASRIGFKQVLRLSDFTADELIASSVSLALKARDEFLKGQRRKFPPLVAASVGPYGATLHDGSEYRGNYGVSAQALKDFHTPRLQLLDGCGADLLACETIPDHTEAKVLHDLLRLVDTPAWISFTCRDDRHISDGTPLKDMAAMFADHTHVLAVGINCTSPSLLPGLIAQVRAAAPHKAVLAYPNSGEQFDVAHNRWLGTVSPLECDEAVHDWLNAGASMVGGCCRMGPEHIAAMRQALDA